MIQLSYMPEDEIEDSTPDAYDTWFSETHGGTGGDIPDFDDSSERDFN